MGQFPPPLNIPGLATQLADLVPVATDGVTATGNGLSGNPIVSQAGAGSTIYFNVKSVAYGAHGDGVTDDTAAIVAAKAAAIAAGGGTLFFPDGTYLISEYQGSLRCINVTTGVSLLGQSRAGAGLKLAAHQRAFVRPLYVGPNASDLSIRNLFIDGNTANQDIADFNHRDNIFLDSTTRVTIDEVESKNAHGSAVVVWSASVDTTIARFYGHDNTWNGVAMGDAGLEQRITVRDSYFHNNASGLHIEVSNPSSHIQFERCVADASAGNWSLEIVGATPSTNYASFVSARDCQFTNGALINAANGVVLDGCDISSADSSGAGPTAVPALKISGGGFDIWVTDCTLSLLAGATASQAVWVAVNGVDTLDNVNILDSAIYVKTANADGITMQTTGLARVRGCKIVGNAGIVTGYGVNINQSLAANMNVAIVRENYIADFKIGVVTQAVNGAIALNEADVSANIFERVTNGVMTSCISWENDARAVVQCPIAIGNKCIGNLVPMFSTYPAAPMIIGGNDGGATHYSYSGSPVAVIAAAVGSTAISRAGGPGTTLYVKEGGGSTSAGWTAVATSSGGAGATQGQAPFSMPWQSGRYYGTPNFGSVGTNNNMGIGTLRAVPFWVPNNITVSELGCEVTGAGDATSVMRLGIYADDGTGRPGGRLLDAGTIDASTVGVKRVTGLALALTPGAYWFVAAQQGTLTTSPTIRTATPAGVIPDCDLGTAVPTAAEVSAGFSMANVNGALPNPFVVSGVASTVPRGILKVA